MSVEIDEIILAAFCSLPFVAVAIVCLAVAWSADSEAV